MQQARGESLTAGRLIADTFSVWGQNASAVIPLVLLVNLAPVVVSVLAYARFPVEPSNERLASTGTFWLAMLVNLLINPVELFGVAHAGVRRLGGEPVGLGELVSASASKYFPALGAWLLLLVAVLGSGCTVVLPFILLTAWAAALPAISEEDLGPIEALRRSWNLTRGSRWPLFGGLLVVELSVGVPTWILQALVGAAVHRGHSLSGLSAGILSGGGFLLQSVGSSVVTTCTAVAYRLLRDAKEAPNVSHLRRVFE